MKRYHSIIWSIINQNDEEKINFMKRYHSIIWSIINQNDEEKINWLHMVRYWHIIMESFVLFMKVGE